MRDHTLSGLPVLPVAGFAELAMAAARDVFGGVALTGMRMVAPLALGSSAEVCVTAQDSAEGLDLSVFARSPFCPEWTLHATATAVRGSRVGSRWVVDPEHARVESGRLLDSSGAVLVSFSDTGSDLVAPPETLCYQAVWREQPLPEARDEAPRVVVLYDSPEWAAGLFSGHNVQAQPLGSPCPEADVVVVLASASTVDESRNAVLSVVELVRTLESAPRLWLATSGAAAVLPGEAGAPGPAALRGLVRVLAFEHPELHASWLDVDTDEALVAEVLAGSAEDEVAWRAGRRYVRRVVPALTTPGSTRAGDAPVVRAGAYVVTGGMGGLGRVAARWLADRGATRVMLSGRRPPSADVSASLKALGCDVRVVTGDIAEPGVAAQLVLDATEGGIPLRGVLHAAGALSDASVLTMTETDLETTWRAKTHGAQRLASACRGHELDWWVAYSSAASLFGSPGQAAYATANAWLDAFCGWLRGQGVPATTVQWGAWSEVGGAADNDNAVLERLSPAEAMPALAAVLANRLPQAGIARFDAARITELFPSLARRPFIGTLLPDDTAGPARSGLAELRADPAAVEEHLRSTVAEMMRTAADRLDVEVPLTALGMDSLLAMRARAAIERDFGLDLPLPLLLRGASLRDLATHIAGKAATPTANGKVAAELGPGARDFAERWVARMWRDVLGDQPAGVHDPFEGDADRLRQQVAHELGAAMPDVDLFSRPTIAGMADLLRPVLELHGGGAVRVLSDRGTADPLFLFHPAGGSTAVYGPLVKLLGDDVPCLGLERLPDLDTVAAKADRYAELILERQPDGPYRLGGWSFGGCLAYETARRLAAAGHEIGLLFLGDTILPLDTSADDYLTGRFRRFVEYVERVYQVDLGMSDADQLADDERFPLVVQRLRERVPGMGEAVLEHQYTSYVDARVAEQYRPEPYDGDVILFRAEQPHPLTTELDPRYLRTDRALGWDTYCANLVVHDVPGDHISMVDPPNVDVIAERVAAALERS